MASVHTQFKNSSPPIVVKSARNEKIIDIDGNEYVDLISLLVEIHTDIAGMK